MADYTKGEHDCTQEQENHCSICVDELYDQNEKLKQELEAARKVLSLIFKHDRKRVSDNDFDGNLRHRKAQPIDYLNHWLKVCRPLAYATQDDSWGELEKLLAIILRNWANIKYFVLPQAKQLLERKDDNPK